MTAFDLYYSAIAAGNIPASVPVDDGLVTVTFTSDLPDVRALATGTQVDRAKLAVYAVNAAREAAKTDLDIAA